MKKNSKIFIIEDDLLNVRLCERVFKSFGYEVECALRGKEALEKLAKMKIKPAVILLDVVMQKPSSFDVLNELKESDACKNIPVVIFTNLAGQEPLQKAIGIGAVVYLVKTQYKPKEMVEKVKEAISIAESTSVSRTQTP